MPNWDIPRPTIVAVAVANTALAWLSSNLMLNTAPSEIIMHLCGYDERTVRGGYLR